MKNQFNLINNSELYEKYLRPFLPTFMAISIDLCISAKIFMPIVQFNTACSQSAIPVPAIFSVNVALFVLKNGINW